MRKSDERQVGIATCPRGERSIMRHCYHWVIPPGGGVLRTAPLKSRAARISVNVSRQLIKGNNILFFQTSFPHQLI